MRDDCHVPAVQKPVSAKREVWVGVFGRAIAAGVASRGSTHRLRTTIALKPLGRLNGGDAHKTSKYWVDLQNWPRVIYSHVGRLMDSGQLSILVCPATSVDGKRPEPDIGKAVKLPAARAFKSPYDDPHGAYLLELWKRLMAPSLKSPTDLDPWGTLNNALLVSAAESQQKPLERKGDDKAAPVFAPPRADSALFISLKRARSILMRIGNGPRHDEIVDDYGPYQPWMGPPNLLQCVAIGTPDSSSENLKDDPEAAEDEVQEREAEKSLEPVRQFASKVAAARTEYLQPSSQLQQVVGALEQLAGTAVPKRNSPAELVTLLASERPDVSTISNTIKNQHWAALRPDVTSDGMRKKSEPPPTFVVDTEAASRRLFAIQAQPTLARLFGFIVDLELSIDADEAVRKFTEAGAQWFATSVQSGPPSSDVEERFTYLFIGADSSLTGAEDQVPMVWTTAKFRTPRQNPRAADGPGFWPCTREEIDLAFWKANPSAGKTEERSSVFQRDGVVDLGARVTTGESRWDLVTLDPVVSVEAETQEACARLHPGVRGGEFDVVCGPTLRTLGMGLVDKRRSAQVVADLVTARVQGRDGQTVIVQDANQLTQGYRLDVGVPVKGARAWRPLNERVVRFRDPLRPDRQWLDDLAVRVHGSKLAYDAANASKLTTLTRLRTDGWQDGKPVQTAVAEELAAAWQGDPLGIQCGQATTVVAAKSDLAINVEYTLPTRGSLRPPPLRFGWRYQLGLRPVFVGGLSVPIREAARLYDSTTASLALPVQQDTSRRFLRHERIDAPLLTVSRLDVDTQRNSSLFDVQAAPLAIVRTVSDPAQRDLETRITRRILVPPVVPQAFAGLHGVLDSSPVVTEGGVRRPEDGLAHVDFMAQAGGFPFLTADGFITSDPCKSLGRHDAVFSVVGRSKGGNAASRRVPYYPDPAVASLMVAIRTRTTDARYLPGPPLKLNLYPAPLRYPHVAVVVIEVHAITKKRAARHASVVRHDPTLDVGTIGLSGAFHPDSLRGWTPTVGVVPALRVRIDLAPGEDFDIETWCVPGAENLYRWFDAVESAALLCTQRGRAGAPEDLRLEYDCAQGFSQICKSKLPTTPDESDSDLLDGVCGAGSLPLPRGPALKALARAMNAAAESRPIPELASVQSFRAVHAIQRPRVAPRFRKQGDTDAILLTVTRRRFAGHKAREEWLSNNPVPSWAERETDREFAGATDVIIGGDIFVDLDTTGSVALQARVVSPAYDRFDDPNRGRSRSERLLGTRPTSMKETFGFVVGATGDVELPRELITLLRIDGLESASRGTLFIEERERVSLLERVDETLSKAYNKAVTVGCRRPREYAERHIFSDTKARKLEMTLVGYSRFRELLQPKRRPDLPAAQLATIDGENTYKVWMPSTRRPDRIDPKTILPSFVWSEESSSETRVERRSKVRIRLRRPWFSSGEDEKLGIVVWPPDLFERSNVAVAAGWVASRESRATRLYNDFVDADLGRGGSFITRWGADPIRMGPSPIGAFIPREAFKDLSDSRSGKPRAELIRSVLLPLPDTDARHAAANDNPEFLTVSLLAYAPKFDWQNEHWYVDVEIDALDQAYPFVRLGLVRYQAHTRVDLQLSEPVAEWVQLLPTRRVVVAVEAPLPDGRGFPVLVQVMGRGGVRAGDEDAPSVTEPEPRHVAQRHRPIVRMTVLRRETRLGNNINMESIAVDSDGFDLVWDSGRDSVDQPELFEGGLRWSHRFVLNEDPRARVIDGESVFAVFIEEIERMKPATYESADYESLEPVPPELEANAQLVDSGPRFMARVPIR